MKYDDRIHAFDVDRQASKIIFDAHVELAKLYAQRGNDVARVRLRAWSISIDSGSSVL